MKECLYYNLKNSSWENICTQVATTIAEIFRGKYEKKGPILVRTSGKIAQDIYNALWKTPGFIPCEFLENPENSLTPIVISPNFSAKFKILINLMPLNEYFSEQELESEILIDYSFSGAFYSENDNDKNQALECSRKRYKQLKTIFSNFKFQALN